MWLEIEDINGNQLSFQASEILKVERIEHRIRLVSHFGCDSFAYTNETVARQAYNQIMTLLSVHSSSKRTISVEPKPVMELF